MEPGQGSDVAGGSELQCRDRCLANRLQLLQYASNGAAAQEPRNRVNNWQPQQEMVSVHLELIQPVGYDRARRHLLHDQLCLLQKEE